MPIYNGSQKLKDIYIGGTKIKKIYNGSTLVYTSSHYTPGQVLFESSTGGTTTTLNLLDSGKYQVICIAGGGGSSRYRGSLRSALAGGGSGSGFDIVFRLSKGNYNISVGEGGSHADGGSGTAGGNSSFGNSYSYGGGGGYTSSNSEYGGSGGNTPLLTYSVISTNLNTAGNAGNAAHSTSGGSYSGGASVYNSYGKGGDGDIAHPKNGNDGYVKVIYIGD